MKIDNVSDKLEFKIENAQNINDLKEVLRDILDENIVLRKRLNAILSSLDSDNITEIDFGRTKYRNASKTITKDMATKTWVQSNFQAKS